jgi:hypothetical protein
MASAYPNIKIMANWIIDPAQESDWTAYQNMLNQFSGKSWATALAGHHSRSFWTPKVPQSSYHGSALLLFLC